MSAQVRRIAILVTSLDSAAGRQLLLAMPSQLARDVRKAMASLTSVDPEEQRRVLAEFRNQAISSHAGSAAPAAAEPAPAKRPSPVATNAAHRSSSSVTGEPAQAPAATPLDLSAGTAADVRDDDSAYAAADATRPWAQLDVASLTDLLRGERPLVIAVVLSQLQPRHAARLLEQFPREQHRAVLAHLTTLRHIDPEAMQAIDEHLASRIADYHHQRDTQSASIGRMQELLAAAAPELRTHWQDIIADSDHQMAKRLGIAVVAKEVPAPTEAAPRPTPRSAAAQSASNSNVIDMLAANVITTADLQVEPNAAKNTDSGPVVLPFPAPASSPQQRTATVQADAGSAAARPAPAAINTLDDILELPPRTIGRVLSAADGEVVLLALAGATPSFMQRFTGMLEKPDARALQARLSALGAINLQDIDEAQRRLCDLASHIVGQLRSRSSNPTPARAAA